MPIRSQNGKHLMEGSFETWYNWIGTQLCESLKWKRGNFYDLWLVRGQFLNPLIGQKLVFILFKLNLFQVVNHLIKFNFSRTFTVSFIINVIIQLGQETCIKKLTQYNQSCYHGRPYSIKTIQKWSYWDAVFHKNYSSLSTRN